MLAMDTLSHTHTSLMIRLLCNCEHVLGFNLTLLPIFIQVLTVKEKDFYAATKGVWFILRQHIAFNKYEPMLELLSDVGACREKEKLPGNANLRSDLIKRELIQCLGRLEKVFEHLSSLRSKTSQ